MRAPAGPCVHRSVLDGRLCFFLFKRKCTSELISYLWENEVQWFGSEATTFSCVVRSRVAGSSRDDGTLLLCTAGRAWKALCFFIWSDLVCALGLII